MSSVVRALHERAFVAVLAVVAIVLSLGLVTNPARAAVQATGSVSGRVVDVSGQPVAGATVTAIDATGVYVKSAEADDSGAYALDDLAAGEYLVSFGSSGYTTQFWPGVPNPSGAVPVVVEGGARVDTVAVSLRASDGHRSAIPTAPETPKVSARAFAAAATSSISGVVTNSSAAPLAGASVTVWGQSGLYTAVTAANGSYSVTGVADGTYDVDFSASGYAGEYYGDTHDPDAATQVTVPPGRTGINASLAPEAKLSGRTLGTGNSPLEGVIVDFFRDGEFVGSAWSAADGAFALDGLAAGSYTLLANRQGYGGPGVEDYASRYYGGAYTAAGAAKVAVVAGQSGSGLDIALTIGRTIVGTVYRADGSVATNASLTAVSGETYRGAGTDPQGRYLVRGLPPVDITLSASWSQFPSTAFMESAYFPSAAVESEATPISLAAGNATGKDIRLAKDGGLTGTITGNAGAGGPAFTLVTPYRWSGDTWTEMQGVTAWSTYEVSGRSGGGSHLPAGTYSVRFSDPGQWATGVVYPYCEQYWSGKLSLETADRFTVMPGQLTSGINANLTTSCTTPAVTAGSVSISGLPQVGSTLKANTSGWSPDPIQLSYQWLADGAPISGATTSTLTPGVAQAGTSIAVRVTGTRPGFTSTSVTSTPVSVATKGEVIRVAGPDRFSTSAAISAATFAPGVPVAYITNGMKFPDALSGGPAAGALGGPVLLVDFLLLPDVTKAELTRLAPKKIIVLGSDQSVADSVYGQLAKYTASGQTADVSRVAGIDRFETSAAISRDAFDPGVDIAYVANGTKFPDALSGGPAGGWLGGPVLLVGQDEVPSAIQKELARVKPKKIVVLGSSASVSGAVFDSLAKYTPGKAQSNVSRLAGIDRYATSAAVSGATFAAGVPVVYVANGQKFPDALSGGPAGGALGGPVLLVGEDSVPPSIAAELVRLKPAKIVVLGSNASVTDRVAVELKQYVAG